MPAFPTCKITVLKTLFHWMKADNTFISCCTDGIKPVVFKLERIEGA